MDETDGFALTVETGFGLVVPVTDFLTGGADLTVLAVVAFVVPARTGVVVGLEGVLVTFFTAGAGFAVVTCFFTGAVVLPVVVKVFDGVGLAGAEYTFGLVTERLPSPEFVLSPRGLPAVCARGPVAFVQFITPLP